MGRKRFFSDNQCIYGLIWPQRWPRPAWIFQDFMQLHVCEEISSNAHTLSWVGPRHLQLREHHRFLILFYLRTEDLAFISTVSSFTLGRGRYPSPVWRFRIFSAIRTTFQPPLMWQRGAAAEFRRFTKTPEKTQNAEKKKLQRIDVQFPKCQSTLL